MIIENAIIKIREYWKEGITWAISNLSEEKKNLTEIQNELRKAFKEYKKIDAMPFNDGPDLELAKSTRLYNKKLRALKEKYNIKDISNTDSHEKS